MKQFGVRLIAAIVVAFRSGSLAQAEILIGHLGPAAGQLRPLDPAAGTD